MLSPQLAKAEDEVLYCTETKSVGFHPDEVKKSYEVSNFKPERFTISFNADQTKVTISNGNARNDIYSCKAVFNINQLACHNRNLTMIFNTSNWKFTRSRLYGYVFNTDGAIGTAFGDCVKF